MESIANKAEVSKRTLYKYYPTKDLLFDGLVEDLLDKAETTIAFPYSPNEGLDILVDKVIDLKIRLLTNPDFIQAAKILLCEQIKNGQAGNNHLRQLTLNYIPLKKWLAKCVADGRISNEFSLDTMSSYLNSLLEGMVLIPVLFNFRTSFSSDEIEDVKSIIKESFLSTFS